MYAVKEIYHTLQGEGFYTGAAAVFLRFSSCNLWSGREQDRATAACKFCDTDFLGTNGSGGGRFETAQALAHATLQCWQAEVKDVHLRPMVVCTGGEPLLQLNKPLIEALHECGFFIAVETNGTKIPPAGIDWTCVSPKAGTKMILQTGDELKLVFPQPGLLPESLIHLNFRHFFLQPMDGPNLKENTQAAIDYCQRDPRWKLSTQMHKVLKIR